MTTETKADDFKVGDQVWCILHGKGIVTAIHKWEDSGEYPVQVNYCNISDYNYYTLDGKLSKECPRALFFSEPKIEASVVRPFVPTLVGKTIVIETKFNREVCYSVVKITSETTDKVFVGFSDFYWKQDFAIYEVSSENLLK